MIKSRRKIFKESLSSVRNEIRDMFEDIKDGLEASRNAGSDLSDIMVVVETWDQGAPVLVKGAYNYYSGDIRCSADEFVDDHDELIRDYMKEFDEEVKERNDMLSDILNKMWDDVDNGDLDEDEYYEEEHRLMDDTCTWSVSVELSKDRDELKSSMAVSVESGDAEVIDSDTRSVDDVERWCKKKSESRIMRESRVARRRNSLRKILEARKNNSNNILDVLKNLNNNTIERLSVKNKYNLGDYWKKAVSLAENYFDILDDIKDLESHDREKMLYAKNNIAGWLLSIYNWKKDKTGFNKFKNSWYKDVWSDDTDEDVLELKQELSVFDPVFDFLKRNVTISGKDSLADINNIKSII